jgi:hypothetical protein
MIRKELRALAPAWLATVTAMVAAEYSHASLRPMSVPIYFIGGVAIGAQVFGREYADRTLSMLLAQPVRRERILFVKLGVLAACLAALAVIAAATLPFPRVALPFRTAAILFPVLAGLCVAPWLTLVSRSAIGGAVFPVAIAGIVLLVSQWVSVKVYGSTREADTLRLAINWWMLWGVSAAGALLTWRTFLRLEAIDGSAGTAAADRPRVAVADTRTRRHPVWLLVRKELRLHRLPFTIAGLYTAGYFLAYAMNRVGASFDDDGLVMLTTIYGGLLALLIGSLASAEERQLGTLEWQALLPMPAWRQWAVKAGTVIGLALALGVVLPWLLVVIFPPSNAVWNAAHDPVRFFLQTPLIVLVVVFATLGLYLSTLCRSGMWALIISMPVVMAGAIVIQSVAYPIERALYRAVGRWPMRSPSYLTKDDAVGVLVGGLVALAIYLALQNHRSAEHGVRRAVPQIAAILGCFIGGYALVMLVRTLR